MPFSTLDLIFLAVFAIFAILGARKGLLLSLCSLLAVVVALIGATLIADALSGPMAAQIAPMVEGFLSEHLDAITAGQAGQEQGFLWALINEALANIDHAAAGDFLTQIAVQVARLLIHPILFAVAFVVVLIAWTFLSHALDLVARLPILHTLNTFGGLLFGAAEGAVLFVVGFLLIRTFFPDLIPPQWQADSVLMHYLQPYGL